ncbi:hypothetical protein OMD49_27930 [Bacillus anthracis]|nr:hypothetical protein [Bacillus anthracis]
MYIFSKAIAKEGNIHKQIDFYFAIQNRENVLICLLVKEKQLIF